MPELPFDVAPPFQEKEGVNANNYLHKLFAFSRLETTLNLCFLTYGMLKF